MLQAFQRIAKQIVVCYAIIINVQYNYRLLLTSTIFFCCTPKMSSANNLATVFQAIWRWSFATHLTRLLKQLYLVSRAVLLTLQQLSKQCTSATLTFQELSK